MNLNSGTQSLIAGAIFDFMGYLTTRPKTVEAGATQNPTPILDHFTTWAAERGLSIEKAMVQDWNTLPGQVTLASVAGADDDEQRRIAGALVDFVEFVKLAGPEDPEKAVIQWATKTGLEIHNPQQRWHAKWWA
jgi:hypothetical protein